MTLSRDELADFAESMARAGDRDTQHVTEEHLVVKLEIWQANADGTIPTSTGSLHRDGWTFTGWGRAGTDDGGRYNFSTVIPGPCDPGAAPFFLITVFARGLLNRLFTRAYVPGGQLAGDPLLASLPPERRDTLIATREGAGLRFDIQLQDAPGKPETVFLRYAGHQR